MTSDPIPDLSSIVSAAEHLKITNQIDWLYEEKHIAY